MWWEPYTYLFLNLGSLAYPLAQSFERRLQYWRQWKFLWPGILANAAFCIAWDMFFTHIKVWQFNPRYVLGFYIGNLPFEEWLFFLIIPFACVFIYECVIYFLGKNLLSNVAVPLALLMAVFLGGVALANLDKWYTSVKLGSTALLLVAHVWWFRNRYFGTFFIAYLFTLIPFALVNGVLTSFPVLIYDNNENLGIRIKDWVGGEFLNIPVEDSVYSLLMLLITISVYEWGRERARSKTVAGEKPFSVKA